MALMMGEGSIGSVENILYNEEKGGHRPRKRQSGGTKNADETSGKRTLKLERIREKTRECTCPRSDCKRTVYERWKKGGEVTREVGEKWKPERKNTGPELWEINTGNQGKKGDTCSNEGKKVQVVETRQEKLGCMHKSAGEWAQFPRELKKGRGEKAGIWDTVIHCGTT